MEPSYKNILKSHRITNEIINRNLKKLEFEDAYMQEMNVKGIII